MLSSQNLADTQSADTERSVKKARHVTMRRVQSYLYAAHRALGAECVAEDTLDIIHHPESSLGSLNYMTPGNNIGWLQGSTVTLGLERMQSQSRQGRMRIIEALFPPFFSMVMKKAGLQLEWQAPLLIYDSAGQNDAPAVPVEMPDVPENLLIRRVTDAKSAASWRSLWDNPDFEITASPVEALNTAGDTDCQHDLMILRDKQLVAAVRIGVQDTTGHIIAQALRKDETNEHLLQLLEAAALELALDKGCSLVFTVGGSEASIEHRRAMGFLDFDSMMCYAAHSSEADEDSHDDDMGQPLLAVR